MSAFPPEPEPDPRRLPRRLGAGARLAARLLLGLFVLWQLLFLPLYNLVDVYMESHLRSVLRESRRRHARQERAEDPGEEGDEEDVRKDGKLWRLVERWPASRRLIEEWIDAVDDEVKRTTIGAVLEGPRKALNWWARRTGQEQGWGLFAPDVVTWCAFPSVELRWDDHRMAPEIGADGLAPLVLAGVAGFTLRPPPPAYEPVVLSSENQPRDVHCFFRVGHFRLRRFESTFEMTLRADDPVEDEDRIRTRVDEQHEAIVTYLRWRVARYRREHPGTPMPRQVILRVQAWHTPAPPGPRPWDWSEGPTVPVARWLPHRGTARAPWLEVYLPTEERFEPREPM